MIGHGAIATGVMSLLADDARIAFDPVVVSRGSLARLRAQGASSPRFVDRLEIGGAARPDLVVECAGHGAIAEHVLPALEAGVDALVVSIGALSNAALAARLEAAALAGGAQVHLLAGAVGGIDALAAARHGGLDEVVYRGCKPPLAWRGTPAEDGRDLAAIDRATVLFEGSAREAAARYPKNANVAATIALAGVGLDATRVTLVADPAAGGNLHRIDARGAFGRLVLELQGEPLASNPKTSALTVFSVVRALTNRVSPITI
ncbi:MAG: aspartate dehydrogenase [Lautropia sp.]